MDALNSLANVELSLKLLPPKTISIETPFKYETFFYFYRNIFRPRNAACWLGAVFGVHRIPNQFYFYSYVSTFTRWLRSSISSKNIRRGALEIARIEK